MTLEQSRQRVDGMIAAILRRWTARETGRLTATGLAGAVAWLLGVCLADNFAMLRASHVLVGWGVLALAAVAWLTRAALALTVRRPRPDRLALMYESRVPAQSNRLINSVQFLAQRLAECEPLAYAAVLENARRVDVRAAGAAVDLRPLVRAVAGFGASCLLLAAYAVLFPTFARNALDRLLHPGAMPPHVLETRIRVSPGNVRVLEGTAVVIEADLSHRVTERAHIEYRLAGLPWTQVAMAPVERGRFRYDGFTSISVPIEYRVRAGRSRSETYALDVRYRPRVASVRVTVTRPAYAGGDTRALGPDQGDVTALAGSDVTVRWVSNNRLSSARLALDEEQEVAAELDPADPRAAAARFKLTRSGSYAIVLTDEAGAVNARPPRYTLTAVPDQSPTVAVTLPGRDLILPADSKLRVAVEARDDIGVGTVTLQVRVGDAEWQDHQTWRLDERNATERAVETVLSLSDLGVATNMAVLYRPAAEDRCEPAPNRTVGRTWSITVCAAEARGTSLAVSQQRRLVDLLEKILALQRENRGALQTESEPGPIRAKQENIRELALAAVAEERQAARPNRAIVAGLEGLASGEMLLCVDGARRYEGSANDELRSSLLTLMDRIIAKLQELVRQVYGSLAQSEKLQTAMERLSPREREKMVEEILAELNKIKQFRQEQAQVIDAAQKVARRVENFRPEDADRLDDLKQVEDKWAEVFDESIKGLDRLAMQDFADGRVTQDYKDMVQDIEEAAEQIESAKQRGQSATSKAGNFKFVSDALLKSDNDAVKAQQKLEEWLSSVPDSERWVQEESAMEKEVGDYELSPELYDMAGELAKESPPLQDTEENEKKIANFWMQADDPKQHPDWAVDDGPTSAFHDKAVTGDKVPDDNLISGRSGDGREGRSAGQNIDSVSKGLPGRKTPTSLTSDPFEEGVIKQLREAQAGGGTGGGKASGAGQEGLQGEAAAPDFGGLTEMKDWQTKMREKKAREATTLKAFRIGQPHMNREYLRLIELFNQAEKNAGDGRYGSELPTEPMVLPHLRLEENVEARAAFRRVDPVSGVPDENRERVLDAMEEPVPEEYREVQRQYFLDLSERSQ